MTRLVQSARTRWRMPANREHDLLHLGILRSREVPDFGKMVAHEIREIGLGVATGERLGGGLAEGGEGRRAQGDLEHVEAGRVFGGDLAIVLQASARHDADVARLYGKHSDSLDLLQAVGLEEKQQLHLGVAHEHLAVLRDHEAQLGDAGEGGAEPFNGVEDHGRELINLRKGLSSESIDCIFCLC